MARSRAAGDVNYGGYSNVCNIGEEIRDAGADACRGRSCSRSSIVVVLYVVMSTVILGMIPWREAQQTRTIASLFIGRTFADPAQAASRRS